MCHLPTVKIDSLGRDECKTSMPAIKKLYFLYGVVVKVSNIARLFHCEEIYEKKSHITVTTEVKTHQ